jgi:hypothetical protein
MNPEQLTPGAWIVMDWCFDAAKFLVYEATDTHVRLVREPWLTSSADWFSRKDVLETRRAAYLGHGKKKWYWKFLPWRDFVKPYTQPVAP